MVNNVFIYPGIGLSVLSSICSFFKNTEEARKEFSEQDRLVGEIKAIIENSIKDNIDINQTEFSSFVNYRPMEKFNRIFFTNMLMFIFSISALWCRSFLYGEDKDKTSALAILLTISTLSAYMNYLHRVFMLQSMGGHTTEKFNLIKGSILTDYKNKLTLKKKQLQNELDASEQHTKTMCVIWQITMKTRFELEMH